METIMQSNFQNYLSQCIKKLIIYYDTGFILNNLESIIFLPIPYKTKSMTMEQYESNKKIALSTIKESQTAYKKFLQELDFRKKTFKQIRNYKPNFANRIQDNLSKEDYQIYLALLKSCSKDISSLVRTMDDRSNDYSDLLLIKKDIISSIIDSEHASKLTNMEDTFILKELESLEDLSLDSETTQNAEKLKKKLLGRIKQNDFFNTIYSSDNQIKLIEKETEKGERD